MSGLRDYALVCLTSPNGARLLFDALEQTNQDARALAGATVAAIGPGTAAELAARGIRADVVPERFVAEGLIDALAPLPLDGQRVLVARAAEARDALPAALRERGAEVHEVALYETVPEALGNDGREALARATYVTFTSSSTVRFFLAPARASRRRLGGIDWPDHQRDGARGGSTWTWKLPNTTWTDWSGL